jgi:hypothetical protein
MQEGGIVRSPTLALLGERGPEAVTPLSRLGGIHIIGPLINIEGSADERLIKAACDRMMRQLRSILVENSSSGSAATKNLRHWSETIG